MRLHEHPLFLLRRTAPTGAKFCTACALPPTVVATPTPATRKRQVPIVAIVLCCIGIVWVVAYASYRYESAKAQRIADGFNAMQAAVADDASLGGINHNHQLEETIEQDLWHKPRELRDWRQTMVERLEQAQQGLRDDQTTDYDDSLVRGDVAFYQAAVARIDWRLKQL